MVPIKQRFHSILAKLATDQRFFHQYKRQKLEKGLVMAHDLTEVFQQCAILIINDTFGSNHSIAKIAAHLIITEA